MINQQDKRTLELFITKVNELVNCKLLQTTHKMKFSLNVVGNQGKATTTLPDEDSLRSFLLIFRNFYSPRERINFLKICDILIDSIQEVSVRDRIEKIREVYKQTLDRSPVHLVENDKSVSPNEIVRRWLYGFYHHTEDAKRKKIEAWGFAAGLTKTQFISTVFVLSKCVIWLGNMVKDFTDGKIK